MRLMRRRAPQLQHARYGGRASRPLRPCRALFSSTRAAQTAADGGSGISTLGQAALITPCVLTFGLGTWQYNRLQWKYGQIDERAKLLRVPPVPIGDAGALSGDKWKDFVPCERGTEFERVKISGRYDHAAEMHVGMRGKPGSATEEERGAGYSIITPFDLSGGARVFINRGWVPKESKSVSSRRAGQLEGHLEVEAVVRRGEKGAWYMPPTTGSDRTMTWIDLTQIASVGNEGRVVDADTVSRPLLFDAVTTTDGAANTTKQGPEPRPLSSYGSFSVTPWKHTVYAMTWWVPRLQPTVFEVAHPDPVAYCHRYGLSFCTALMYLTRISSVGRSFSQRVVGRR